MKIELTHAHVCHLTNNWTSTPDRVQDLRLIYIKSGHGLWTVDRQTHLLRPRDLIVLRPGQTRHARMFPKQSVRYVALRFNMEADVHSLPPWLMLPSIIPLQDGFHIEVERSLFTLMDEFKNRNDFYIDMIDVTAKELLLRLARYHQRRSTRSVRRFDSFQTFGERMPEIDRVVHYIHEHLNESIDVGDLARLAGMSPSHFRRTFRKLTGMPPQKYIIRSRIWQAKELLQEGSFYVYEVAQAVGYKDSFYFSRLFHKETGMSPSAYASKYRVPVLRSADDR